nr:GyrI-like domain-containing protein [uncultured Sphaerochaeta sp.]
MDTYDVKKELKQLYHLPKEPTLVEVPSLSYLIIDGEGDPSDQAYTEAVELLFSMSYTLKMAFRKHSWYKPFTVAPLECIWDAVEVENRETWLWSAMIAQPGWVTEEIVSQVREQVAFKKGLSTSLVRFSPIEEGLCVTMLHVGSYQDEDASFARMEQYCAEHQLKRSSTSHREIYLSNPKKTEPDQLKTVLRFAVHPIG